MSRIKFIFPKSPKTPPPLAYNKDRLSFHGFRRKAENTNRQPDLKKNTFAICWLPTSSL